MCGPRAGRALAILIANPGRDHPWTQWIEQEKVPRCPGVYCPRFHSSSILHRIFAPDHRVKDTRVCVPHILRVANDPVQIPGWYPNGSQRIKYENWRGVFLDLAGGSSSFPSSWYVDSPGKAESECWWVLCGYVTPVHSTGSASTFTCARPVCVTRPSTPSSSLGTSGPRG